MTPPSSAPSKSRIALFHAGGREAEIEEVFRRILAAGAPLDQVEIACASDAHVALVWEKALRHDWPVTLGPGIPATLTRPGRALIGSATGSKPTSRPATSVVCCSPATSASRSRTASRRVRPRACSRAPKPAGAARPTPRARAPGQDYEARAADPDASDDDRAYATEQAEQATHVRAWLTALVDSIPEPAKDGTVPLQAVVDAALAFLEHRTARRSALDHRAAAALADYVGELRALGAFSCALPGALRFIRERVQSLSRARAPAARPSLRLHLSQAGYAGRAHVFVVGLEEGRVFVGRPKTRCCSTRSARRSRRTCGSRPTGSTKPSTPCCAARRLGAHVTFSYSCRDTGSSARRMPRG